MEKLDSIYINKLEAIKNALQESDLLTQFLEEESDQGFLAIREQFEPSMHTIYMEVGSEKPLQLLDLEQHMMDPAFEGLYLPKILGYTVLRGDVDENFKYRRPQDQFSKAVHALASNNNFEILKAKTGQTLQVGFSLSSDIWVSNLIDHIDNKRSKAYFETIRSQRHHELNDRKNAYVRYARQFEGAPYHSAEFPQTPEDLKSLHIPLKDFLIHRINHFQNNDSFLDFLMDLVKNEKLKHMSEYWEIVFVVVNFFKLEGLNKAYVRDVINNYRASNPGFSEEYFQFLQKMRSENIHFDAAIDRNVQSMLDNRIEDDLVRYYDLAEIIHSNGYMHEDTIEAVRNFYEMHEGLSTINTTVRHTILGYFKSLLNNLTEVDYSDYFQMCKIFNTYMKIFSNEKFNQEVQNYNQQYIHRLLEKYNDKRGKDYQEIKKFVSGHFAELEYMKEKDINELFKNKRKKVLA